MVPYIGSQLIYGDGYETQHVSLFYVFVCCFGPA